jgi:hypothetical protein
MFGIAAGSEMKIGIVPRNSHGLARIVLRLLRQPLEAVENLLGHQVPLFNPAFGAACCTDSCEATVAVQNVDPIAIFYGSSLVVNGGHAVPKKGLRGGDIIGFENPASAPSATGKQQDCAKQ